MIRCEIVVSCAKRIGDYSDRTPDIRKEHEVRFQLESTSVEELKDCSQEMVEKLLEKMDELDKQCDFDTEKELAAYNKYYR